MFLCQIHLDAFNVIILDLTRCRSEWLFVVETCKMGLLLDNLYGHHKFQIEYIYRHDMAYIGHDFSFFVFVCLFVFFLFFCFFLGGGGVAL